MPQRGLSNEAIEQETAVVLPERDALSLVDGGVRLVPISPVVVPSPQPVDPSTPVVDTVGQGIDERATE